MQPEPERIDLSALDMPNFDGAVERITARALELRRFRSAVARRGVIAAVLVAAASVMLWLSAPRRPAPRHADVLGWAVGATTPDQVLSIGGDHAE
jgi:hypothetical protein